MKGVSRSGIRHLAEVKQSFEACQPSKLHLNDYQQVVSSSSMVVQLSKFVLI